MAQYENKGDRLNILLADELPEDMTGTQDTQHICGNCAWYSFRKLESTCRKTGKEVAYFATKECFTTEKDTTMDENTNAQPVAESTGTQVCKECGRTLPLEDFQRLRNGNLDKVCKACRAKKARIGIARKKAVKVENPGLVVTSEEVSNAKRVYIAQLSRYLTDFKMAGLALWGMLPGKEEDIDQIIKAEWAVPFCREIFAAAAELKRDGANVVPSLVAKRLGGVGQKFVDDLGNAFYPLAKECDTSEQKPSEEKPVQGKVVRFDVGIISGFSDAALLDELRRRGYKGRISKCEEVEI